MKNRGKTNVELVIGTTGGVAFLRGGPSAWESLFGSLEGEDVSVLRHHPGKAGTIFAGTYGNGLFRSDDGGKSWVRRDAGQPHLRTVAFDPEDPETVYAGTEPAELYRSRDGGETWSSVGLQGLPEAPSWSLPYSPRAGALRALLVPAGRTGLIYAGVEQGGLVKSEDGGRSWTVTENGVHKDIHSLFLDEENPEILYAATGGGFFRTRDGGTKLGQAPRRLHSRYLSAGGSPPSRPGRSGRGRGRGRRLAFERRRGRNVAASSGRNGRASLAGHGRGDVRVPRASRSCLRGPGRRQALRGELGRVALESRGGRSGRDSDGFAGGLSEVLVRLPSIPRNRHQAVMRTLPEERFHPCHSPGASGRVAACLRYSRALTDLQSLRLQYALKTLGAQAVGERGLRPLLDVVGRTEAAPFYER